MISTWMIYALLAEYVIVGIACLCEHLPGMAFYFLGSAILTVGILMMGRG